MADIKSLPKGEIFELIPILIGGDTDLLFK